MITKRMQVFLTELSSLMEKYDARIDGYDKDCFMASDGIEECCNIKFEDEDIDSDFIKQIIEEKSVYD